MYWRRRFMALLAGMAVLGIVSWAISGTVGGGTSRNAADVGRAGPQPSGRAGTGARQGLAPSLQPSASGPPAGLPAPGTRSARAQPSPPAAGRRASPPACPPADVVLSLTSSQASYGPGQPADFTLDVVSTAAGTCSFNIGPRYLAVMVMAGARRIWDSADCAPAPGSVTASLTRGVPIMLPVSWDRQTSAPRCPAAAAPAAAGQYVATAGGSGLASAPVTIGLS